MDKKRLAEPTVSEVNDNRRPKTDAKSDYGTSPRELQEKEPTEFLSCRRILYTMMFSGFAVAYCLRVSLSEAIVAMVNQTAVSEDTATANTIDKFQCPRDPQLQRRNGELVWNRHEQGTVLAAFYYGYICTQVIAGWMGDRVGGKWLFGGGIVACAALTLLTPPAAYLHVVTVIVLRILEGAFEGFMLPATHALLSRWTPAAQSTRCVTMVFSGQEFGIVVGILLAGVLSDNDSAGGWPSVFYVFGTVGCVWSVAWCLLGYSSPSTHPRISTSERDHLVTAVGTRAADSADKPRTPWRKVLTSRPLWACCVAKFAHNWGYHTILEGLPMFYYDVLGFNMTKNGLLASLPFLLGCFMLVVAGQLADWLRAPAGKLSTTAVRKIFLSCGLILPSVFLIMSGFFGCNRTLVVFTMIMAISCAQFAWSCVTVNSLDLSVIHAATLLGITNTSATLASIAAPNVIGALTYNRSTRAQWRKVFYITAAVEWFGTIVYLLFGSGEPQDWQDDTESL